jgi:hypothetical protein
MICAVWENDGSLLREIYNAHKYSVWPKCRHVECLVHVVTTGLQDVKPYLRLTELSQFTKSL